MLLAGTLFACTNDFVYRTQCPPTDTLVIGGHRIVFPMTLAQANRQWDLYLPGTRPTASMPSKKADTLQVLGQVGKPGGVRVRFEPAYTPR